MATQTAADAPERAVNRKSRVGIVVSDRNDQTVIVAVERRARHRLYHKVITRTKRYPVHDPENAATRGDLVRIEECRPISKTKRWRLAAVLTEREVADVEATEIDASLVQDVQRSAARAAEEAGEVGAGADAGTAVAADAAGTANTADAAGAAVAADAGAEEPGAGTDADAADDAAGDGER